MKLKRTISAAIALSMVISAFAFTQPAEVMAAEVTYPLQKAPKLTYWVELNGNVSGKSKSLNETPFAKGLIEKTGIEVEFIHPATGSGQEQFNLMLSSQNMPDIVEFGWINNYPSGMDTAIRNNIAYKLNDKMAEWAPDFTAYMENNPDIAKMAKTDTGNYFGFPFVRGDEAVMTFVGPIIRKDWLDDLKLSMPETIDDWTKVLTAFKEKKSATSPLTGYLVGTDPLSMFTMANSNTFLGAYGVGNSFYVDNETIKHGAIEQGYKEWIIQMNKWYKDGLLNKDFATDARAEADAKFTSGKAGAIIGYAGNGIGGWIPAFATTDKKAVLAGTKYPVLKKGETPAFGQKDFPIMSANMFAVVNAKSPNAETAFKLLNFGYTTEGNMYYNFGTEGRDYEMIAGYPTMSQDILKGKDPIGTAWAQIARASYNGPFMQRLEYFQQYMAYPVQIAAVANWSKTTAEQTNMPPVSISESESREYGRISVNLTAFIGEWVSKAIMGTADVNKFESEFVANLKDIGIDRAIEIQQAAYDRYMKR